MASHNVRFLATFISFFLISATVVAQGGSPLTPHLCYAPGTPVQKVATDAHQALWNRMAHSLSSGSLKYQLAGQWTATATDGGGIQPGEPLTLTWSIVPDGTSVFGYNGEPAAPSNLRAFLNGIYGSEANWLPIVQQVFARWGELTGITYVYEPIDDGAAMTQTSLPSGRRGVRGDVRIAGHRIDGSYGVLAYNFFPNLGDMVIDTGDDFFRDDAQYFGSRGLRNTLAHEHGHGLGLNHVCPLSDTKLMEPMLSLDFEGPQHDDILAVNRAYGDDLEANDAPGTATHLGNLGASQLTFDNLSLDDSSDVDYYSFNVAAGASVNLTVTPLGAVYPQGPQTLSGCSAGESFDSLRVHDLRVRVLTGDGSTVLANVDLASAGVAEVLNGVALTSGAGTYLVEVRGGTTDGAQLYRLEMSSGSGSSEVVFTDGFESGSLNWSSVAVN